MNDQQNHKKNQHENLVKNIASITKHQGFLTTIKITIVNHY